MRYTRCFEKLDVESCELILPSFSLRFGFPDESKLKATETVETGRKKHFDADDMTSWRTKRSLESLCLVLSDSLVIDEGDLPSDHVNLQNSESVTVKSN